MLTPYMNKGNNHVCSIQQLNHEIEKDELLLSNYKKNDTIIEEEQDELFSLYITPYSEKDMKVMKNKDNSTNVDTTIIKGSQREEPLFQVKCQKFQEEIRRLKKMIFKKNKVIGQLTEELKNCYEHPQKRNAIMKQFFHQYNSQHYEPIKCCNESKENQCRNNKCKNQLAFFQKNNQQLFEQMNSYKVKFQKLQKDFTSMSERYEKAKTKLEKLQAQNTLLKKENISLLKSTKKYLNQGSKQIKIISKMREVLAQKLTLKQMNIQIPDFSSKGYSNNSSMYKTQKDKRMTESNEFCKSSKSLERQINSAKDKRHRERCISSDTKKAKN